MACPSTLRSLNAGHIQRQDLRSAAARDAVSHGAHEAAIRPNGALDLLCGARRLWKLRFDSCRLVDLENQILGFEREGDLPGEMIPYVYFEYLRKREASRIVPILHHNAIDILTLACLTAIVPRAFQSPEDAPLTHGAEMVGPGALALPLRAI